MEKIINIQETVATDCSGYIVTTSSKTIKMVISNDQDCCEEFGYMMSEDNVSRYIGANFLGIDIVDTDYEKYSLFEKVQKGLWRDEKEDDNEDGRITYAVFVDIKTNVGVLQFVLYNNHNGYYGHTVSITHEKRIIL